MCMFEMEVKWNRSTNTMKNSTTYVGNIFVYRPFKDVPGAQNI